jgi:hypothetical protein
MLPSRVWRGRQQRVDGYDDPAQEGFHEAIRRVIALDRSVWTRSRSGSTPRYQEVVTDD